jgi:predicted membrane channel-forming protein YqfA (hemolysin III family)
MNLVHNERIRLLARLLNNRAVGTFITAIIVPVVGLVYGSPTAPVSAAWWLVGAAWLIAGVVLHIVAQASTREAQAVTDVQLYLLVAPLVLLALGAIAYWWAAALK